MKELVKYYIIALCSGIAGFIILCALNKELFNEESIIIAVLTIFLIDSLVCGIIALVRYIVSHRAKR